MNHRERWIIAGAALLALVIGVAAWYGGVNYGMAETGRVAAGPDGHWHHHHGGFFFWPLFLIFFWLVLFRGFRRQCAYDSRLDEWHRRAHERMWNGERQPDDPDRR